MAYNSTPVVIGSVTIDVPQALQLNVSYQKIGGFTNLRALAGNSIRQYLWSKWRVTISGEGYLPSGLADLNWTNPVNISTAYGPTITAFCSPPQLEADRTNGTLRWTIEAEEV